MLQIDWHKVTRNSQLELLAVKILPAKNKKKINIRKEIIFVFDQCLRVICMDCTVLPLLTEARLEFILLVLDSWFTNN